MPLWAEVRRFWMDPVPCELSDLTYLERNLITPVRALQVWFLDCFLFRNEFERFDCYLVSEGKFFKAIVIVKPPGGFKGPPDECLRKSTGSVLYMEQPVSGNVRQVESKSLPNAEGFKIIVVAKSNAKVNVNVVNWSRVSVRFCYKGEFIALGKY